LIFVFLFINTQAHHGNSMHTSAKITISREYMFHYMNDEKLNFISTT
jgi:hypothetical protein